MCAGATDPENLLYMTRLGLWGRGTAFKNRMTFCKLLNARGVGAMELVAMDLKMQGDSNRILSGLCRWPNSTSAATRVPIGRAITPSPGV